MAKIKHTKTELKAQREALKRYERFLPMLQLKKQQLQMEIQSITARVGEILAHEELERARLDAWIKLLSEPVDLDALVVLEHVATITGNIAGVNIPVLKDVVLQSVSPDLLATPAWVDDAAEILMKIVRWRAEREILEEQRRLVEEELRVTTQRVNLFEKVKIPECRENIRVIKIFLGDEMTASVARGKIAKRRTGQREDAGQPAGAEAAGA